MEKDMSTLIRFGYTTFSFGADDEEGLMYLAVCHEDEPKDYEGRDWEHVMSMNEMEYLAHRMLDAVAYQRKQHGLEEEWDEFMELEKSERVKIKQTLEICSNDRKKAAERLGISERTLYRKMKEYEID